jgi:uncharacterized protein (TIGR02145 family)
MKRKIVFLAFSLFIFGMVTIIFSACKKDSDDNNNNNIVYPITDIDGNVYNAVTIGTQTWMVENLKVTHYRNGDPIPLVTDQMRWENLTTEGYCWYDNEPAYKPIYGALYNWYTVNDSRNIAPVGWHVPTDAEWATLISFAGGNNAAAAKLKEAGKIHWLNGSDMAGVANQTGFTALPGGFRSFNGLYGQLQLQGFWWSATAGANPEKAWSYVMQYNTNTVTRFENENKCGFSVRCIKD